MFAYQKDVATRRNVTRWVSSCGLIKWYNGNNNRSPLIKHCSLTQDTSCQLLGVQLWRRTLFFFFFFYWIFNLSWVQLHSVSTARICAWTRANVWLRPNAITRARPMQRRQSLESALTVRQNPQRSRPGFSWTFAGEASAGRAGTKTRLYFQFAF